MALALAAVCSPAFAQRGGTPGSGANGSAIPTYYSIRGKVVDPENHAQLEGARVELRSYEGAVVGSTLTRTGGDFEFRNLSSGRYDIVVQQAGYRTVTQRLEMTGSILGLSVELHPISAPTSTTPRLPPVSARELAIPRKAHEAMDKGLELIAKKADYRGSIKQFEHAIQTYPGYYEAYTEIGIACMHAGNNVGAEEALRKAVELSQQQDVDALSWLATVRNDTLHFADAEPIARTALGLDASSWQANAELARSLLGLGRPAEAEKSALAAAKLQPENAVLYLVLANIHSQLANPSALLEDLTNYLSFAPKGPMADRAREQQKQLRDELRAQQTLSKPVRDPLPEISAPAPQDVVAETPPMAAAPDFDASPILKSGAEELKPVLWPPTNVDASVPAVASGVACPLEKVLKGTRQRVNELLENVDRFTATEAIDYDEIGKDGRSSRSLKYTFDYVADFSLGRDGD